MPNAFCSLIGTDIPIVQAAMGGATSPQLAAAVSNAGGLGMLAHRLELRPMRCAPRSGRQRR